MSDSETNEDYCQEPTFAFVQKAESAGSLKIGAALLSPRKRSDQHDPKTRSIEILEFVDCEQLSNLEALLLRTRPKVCYYIEFPEAAKAERRRVENLLASLDITAETCSRSMFRTDTIEQDLTTLTGEDSLLHFKDELSLKLALEATACVFKKDLAGNEELHGACTFSIGNLDKYVRLDVAALEALNLFPGKDAINKECSVFGVLNRCCTKNIGSRLLSRWIRQPLIDISEINRRQTIVSKLVEDRERLENVRACLKRIPDLDVLVRKFERDRAGLQEMYILYLFADSLPQLAAALMSSESGENEPSEDLKQIGTKISELCNKDRLGKYKQLVQSVLDFDLAPREFRMKPCHDKSGKLSQLAREIASVEEKVDQIRENLEANELAGMGAKFESDPKMLKTYGYHFRVHKKNDNALKRLDKSKYKYLNVVSSGIKWTSTKLSLLYENNVDLTTQYNRAQAILVKNAASVAKSFMPLVEVASTLTAELDVLMSFAYVASFAPSSYVCPKMYPLGTGFFSVKGARHPCLELQEDVDFIANDFELNPETSRFQLITGPNMGGKSTYIRQLGILSVMAQIGSFVPCEEATLPVIDAVLARVGASDLQLRGVSTFMAEMIEASAILKTGTSNSLIIIDELGRGTSTYDGFGLAWAISERIANELKSYCVFATHFHEMTALSDVIPCVVNRHVTALATDDSVTMLYTINPGPCNKSFGINIAKLAGFPADVIETAKRKVKDLEGKSNDTKSNKKCKTKAKDLIAAFSSMNEADLTSAQLLKSKLGCLITC